MTPILAACAIALPLFVPQTGPRFAAQQLPSDLAVGPRAEFVRTADLDNDGLHDAVAPASGGLLSYLASPGGRLRGPLRSVVSAPQGATPIALGHVNSDGIVDAVYRNSTQLVWAPGDGKGRFRAALPVAPFGTLRQIALADMDGDGDQDVVAATSTTTQVLLGNGAGAFVPLAPVNVAGPQAVGDLDGNGVLDLLTAGNGLRAALGAGGGVLVPQPSVPFPFLAMSLALGDLDGDGDLDAVVGGWSEYAVFLNNGAGVFSAAGPAVGAPATTLTLFDWDDDGLLDLLRGDSVGAGQLPDGGLTWSAGDGAGAFTSPTRLPAGAFPAVLPPVDVSGDGRADLVCGILPGFYITGLTESGGSQEMLSKVSALVRDAGTGIVGRVESAGPGIFASTAWRLAGDVDADGEADLISYTWSPSGSYLYRAGSAAGVFGPEVSIAMPFNPMGVDLGDVNGDGIADLFAWRIDQALVRLGDGLGGYGPDVLSTLPASTFPSLVDWNGDGRVDVVQASNVMHVSLGQANGQFVASASQAGLVGTGFQRAFADLDGDGDMDALIGLQDGFGTSTYNLVRGDGTGAIASTQVVQFVQAQSIALGDLDGDGDVDLAAGRSGTQAGKLYDLVVMLNDGSGNFGDARVIEAGASPWVQAVADLDGDGRGEVLATVESGALVIVGLRPKHQLAVDLPVLRSHHGLTYTERLAGVTDVDGDGRLDVVVHGFFPAGPTVLFNQGP